MPLTQALHYCYIESQFSSDLYDLMPATMQYIELQPYCAQLKHLFEIQHYCTNHFLSKRKEYAANILTGQK